MQELLQSGVVREWWRAVERVLGKREEEKGYDELSKELLSGGSGRESQSQNLGENEVRAASSSIGVVPAGVVATESVTERETRSEARLVPARVRTPIGTDTRTVDPRQRARPNQETTPVRKGEEPEQMDGVGKDGELEEGEVEEGEIEDDELEYGELEEGEVIEGHASGLGVAQREMEAEPMAIAYQEARSRQEQTSTEVAKPDDVQQTQDVHTAAGLQVDFFTS